MKNFFNLFLIALVGAFLVGCGDSKSSSQPNKENPEVEDPSKTPPAPAADPKGLNAFFKLLLEDKKELTIGFKSDFPAPKYTTEAAAAAAALTTANRLQVVFSSASALKSFKITGGYYGFATANNAATGSLVGGTLTEVQIALMATVASDASKGEFSVKFDKPNKNGLYPAAPDANVSNCLMGTNAAAVNALVAQHAPYSGTRNFEFTVTDYNPSTFTGTGVLLLQVSAGDRADAAHYGTNVLTPLKERIVVDFSFPTT